MPYTAIYSMCCRWHMVWFIIRMKWVVEAHCTSNPVLSCPALAVAAAAVTVDVES